MSACGASVSVATFGAAEASSSTGDDAGTAASIASTVSESWTTDSTTAGSSGASSTADAADASADESSAGPLADVPEELGPLMLGVMGFSNTRDAVEGLQTVPGGPEIGVDNPWIWSWEEIQVYSGGTVMAWSPAAQDLAAMYAIPTNYATRWHAFDAAMAAHPETNALWLQVANSVQQLAFAGTAAAVTWVPYEGVEPDPQELQWLGATLDRLVEDYPQIKALYVSAIQPYEAPQNSQAVAYDPPDGEGPFGVERAEGMRDWVLSSAAANGGDRWDSFAHVVAGPQLTELGPSSFNIDSDGSHPNQQGQIQHGWDLFNFFFQGE